MLLSFCAPFLFLGPKLFNAKDTAPDVWLNNNEFIYIGRFHRGAGVKSKWGNPFKVSDHGRTQAIELFKNYVFDTPTLFESLHELTNKNLVCHCAPLACHGDVLKDLANNIFIFLPR